MALNDAVAFAIMARYIGYEELAAYAIVRVVIGKSGTFKAGILSSQSALCILQITFFIALHFCFFFPCSFSCY